MGIRQIDKWYSMLKDGRMSLESDLQSSRPSTGRNDDVTNQVLTLALQEHAVKVGLSTGSVYSILCEGLAMWGAFT